MASSSTPTTITVSGRTFVETPNEKHVTDRNHEGGKAKGTLAFERMIWNELQQWNRDRTQGGPDDNNDVNDGVGLTALPEGRERKDMARILCQRWCSVVDRAFLMNTRVWISVSDHEKVPIVRQSMKDLYGSDMSEDQIANLVVAPRTPDDSHNLVMKEYFDREDVLVGTRQDECPGNKKFADALKKIMEENNDEEHRRDGITRLMTTTCFVKLFRWEVESDEKMLLKKTKSWIGNPRRPPEVDDDDLSIPLSAFSTMGSMSIISAATNPPFQDEGQQHQVPLVPRDTGNLNMFMNMPMPEPDPILPPDYVVADGGGGGGVIPNADDLTMDDFSRISIRSETTLPYADRYESEGFRIHFDKLGVLVDNGYRGRPSTDWAADWARDVRNGGYAKELDRSRIECLKLLYEMYDTHKNDPLGMGLLRDQFNEHRVSNLLQVCLPMDRANALYHMQIVRGRDKPRGMHWISEQHIHELKNSPDPILQRALDGYQHTHSMNKRLQWILDLFGLANKEPFAELMKPVLLRNYIADPFVLARLEERAQYPDCPFRLQGQGI